jgi:hypothetical protein
VLDALFHASLEVGVRKRCGACSATLVLVHKASDLASPDSAASRPLDTIPVLMRTEGLKQDVGVQRPTSACMCVAHN